MTKQQKLSICFDISIGTRVLYGGKNWEITFVDQHNQRICFREIHGSVTFYFSFGRFAKKLRSEAIVVTRKTPALTIKSLVAATLEKDDRIDFERRCAYVKFANEFEDRAPKKDLMQAVHELCAKRNEENKAANDDWKPEKAPSYSRLKKWQLLVRQTGTLLPLALPDHRKKQRASRIDPAVEELINAHVEDIFKKIRGATALDVHDAVVTAVDTLNEGAPSGSARLQPPALKTIYRRLEALDQYAVDLARNNEEFVRKKYRYGASLHIPPFISAIVQADCHQLDLMIYDDMLGITYRPWLIVFIDCHTRCIVGWELSELAPSAEKVMRCFKQAISDSPDSLYRCIPTRLIFDNGVEFINESIKTAASMLLCTIEYGQVRTPNSKSIVERFFRTLITAIHKLPGTTFSNVIERADYDSEGNAIYSLAKARELLADFLNYYHLRTHWQLGVSPDTQWRLACDRQEPRIIDAESAATLGTKMRKCSINGGRIGFKGLYWHAPSLPQMEDSLRATGDKALLSYDESDLGYAWVRHPRKPNEVVRCDPVYPEYQTGLTMLLHDQIRQTKKEYEEATGNPAKARLLRLAFTMKIIADLDSEKSRKTNRRRAKEMSQALSEANQLGLDLTPLLGASNPETVNARLLNAVADPVVIEVGDNSDDDIDFAAI